MLSICEQKLICRMSEDENLNWDNNGIYRNRQAFYRATGHLKKSDIIFTRKKSERHVYKLTIKGIILALALKGT
jgi:predicted transcriptional regulator